MKMMCRTAAMCRTAVMCRTAALVLLLTGAAGGEILEVSLDGSMVDVPSVGPFHAEWLYERSRGLADVPAKVKSATLTDATKLSVTFSDESTSIVDISVKPLCPKFRAWNASLVLPPSLEGSSSKLHGTLQSVGVVIVNASCESLAKHFGTSFREDDDDESAELRLIRGEQELHLADGFQIAELMARETPELYEALRTTPVTFHNGIGTHLETTPPCLKAVRFGPSSPLLRDPGILDVYYRAKRRFLDLARDPALTVTLNLHDGLLVDTKRILHSGRGSCSFGGGIVFPSVTEGSWASLEEATKDDYDKMAAEFKAIDMTDRLLAALDSQRGLYFGQPVDLREHGLQTASRAFRAGESDDIVVGALLHDVTEHVVPKGHGDAAAALLAPFVDLATQWILKHHEIFQGFYYFHLYGGDRFAKLAFRDSPYFNLTQDWCHRYDQASYDPFYPTLPFEFFRPILHRVFNREPYWWDPTHLKRTTVTPEPSAASSSSLAL